MRRKRINRKQMRTDMRYLYIVSLGCPKNLVDTEVITASLLTSGFVLTTDPDNADVYLINTCAFIAPARDEADEAIATAVSWKKCQPENRRIIISGCLIQWDKKNIYSEKYPEVDLWTGIDCSENVGREALKLFDDEAECQHLMDEVPTYLYNESTPRLQLTMPHLAYLKISDGCVNRCAYCSIPDIRGDLRSRSVDSVVKEAENLRRNGVVEFILIAQDTSAYGDDLNAANENLPELLYRLNRLDDGVFWIRILYTHPASFSDELIKAIAECEHVLPYVDIPLQHISTPVLQRMRRKCDRSQICDLMAKLRQQIPGVVLRTTFITGFPGETEADYQELYKFVEEQQFERLGVFAYSDEPGTPAAEFENKVPVETGASRRDKLMALQKKISLNINKSFVGTELDVIVDIVQDESIALARSAMDAPEIDNEILIEHDGSIDSGDIVRIEVTGADAYTLSGKLIS